MTDDLATLLAELKHGLAHIYGDRLKGLYLYGSCARGQHDSESDVDVLVVLDRFTHYGAEIDATSQLRAELSLQHAVSLSTVFVQETDWLHADTPFLRNVRDESVAA